MRKSQFPSMQIGLPFSPFRCHQSKGPYSPAWSDASTSASRAALDTISFSRSRNAFEEKSSQRCSPCECLITVREPEGLLTRSTSSSWRLRMAESLWLPCFSEVLRWISSRFFAQRRPPMPITPERPPGPEALMPVGTADTAFSSGAVSGSSFFLASGTLAYKARAWRAAAPRPRGLSE